MGGGIRTGTLAAGTSKGHHIVTDSTVIKPEDIIDEQCSCGHRKAAHADGVHGLGVIPHIGACLHADCQCIRFTRVGWRVKTKTGKTAADITAKNMMKHGHPEGIL